uniref:Uncharacterized protein LOC105125661 isoform X1 n=1 Tax=Rhizophora mucronata TaxID=61149 RepID=A0A2P2MJ33_RHIMU
MLVFQLHSPLMVVVMNIQLNIQVLPPLTRLLRMWRLQWHLCQCLVALAFPVFLGDQACEFAIHVHTSLCLKQRRVHLSLICSIMVLIHSLFLIKSSLRLLHLWQLQLLQSYLAL